MKHILTAIRQTALLLTAALLGSGCHSLVDRLEESWLGGGETTAPVQVQALHEQKIERMSDKSENRPNPINERGARALLFEANERFSDGEKSLRELSLGREALLKSLPEVQESSRRLRFAHSLRQAPGSWHEESRRQTAELRREQREDWCLWEEKMVAAVGLLNRAEATAEQQRDRIAVERAAELRTWVESRFARQLGYLFEEGLTTRPVLLRRCEE